MWLEKQQESDQDKPLGNIKDVISVLGKKNPFSISLKNGENTLYLVNTNLMHSINKLRALC